MDRSSRSLTMVVLILLFCGIIGLQCAYDAAKMAPPVGATGGLSPFAVRLVDLGFHPAVASFLWASTMPEILDLLRGRQGYVQDVAFVNAIDPKLSYPYAFTVLTLPLIPSNILPNAAMQANAIGEEGIASADPDWRIPYYMAINYYLGMKDLKDATWYFNVAANTPGVPQFAARFALNFGIEQKDRDRIRGIWQTVYETTNDPATKERAAAYIARMNDFDYLEAAATVYKERFGKYPAAVEDMVAKGIVPAVPEDPFGFSFIIKADGTAAIDLTKLPSYLTSHPAL